MSGVSIGILLLLFTRLVLPLIADPSWLSDVWAWLSKDESGSTTIRNLGLVGGGVIALCIAYWRSRIADRQAATSQQQLLDEQHRQGAAMLGSELLPVRLAGIYALRRLAEEHPQHYHIQVMRQLCSFARRPPLPKPDDSGSAPRRLREDIVAAVEAISACHEAQQELEQELKYRLDLRGLDLSLGQFERLNLSGAQLAGARFVDANLHCVRLAGADLMDARFSSIEAASEPGDRGASSSLEGAVLTGANLRNAKLIAVALTKADLSGAFLTGADLSEAGLFDANLAGASMTGTILTRTGFFGDSTSAAEGLTQAQLDLALADSPPILGTLRDAATGKRLVWRGDRPSQKHL